MNKPVLPMSSLSLKLPTVNRGIETYRLAASRAFPAKLQGTLNRVAFSAAHVVADPLADVDPWLSAAVDWDRTIAFREHVWDLGLGVAEAMDTAQRGMGLDWPTSLELIQRTVAAAGCYVPGGRAAYPSSLVMAVVPAQVAGVGRIAVASAPGPDGLPADVVLAAAAIIGVDEVYAVGGAAAIAAFAVGTSTIAAVSVITGSKTTVKRSSRESPSRTFF